MATTYGSQPRVLVYVQPSYPPRRPRGWVFGALLSIVVIIFTAIYYDHTRKDFTPSMLLASQSPIEQKMDEYLSESKALAQLQVHLASINLAHSVAKSYDELVACITIAYEKLDAKNRSNFTELIRYARSDCVQPTPEPLSIVPFMNNNTNTSVTKRLTAHDILDYIEKEAYSNGIGSENPGDLYKLRNCTMSTLKNLPSSLPLDPVDIQAIAYAIQNLCVLQPNTTQPKPSLRTNTPLQTTTAPATVIIPQLATSEAPPSTTSPVSTSAPPLQPPPQSSSAIATMPTIEMAPLTIAPSTTTPFSTTPSTTTPPTTTPPTTTPLTTTPSTTTPPTTTSPTTTSLTPAPTTESTTAPLTNRVTPTSVAPLPSKATKKPVVTTTSRPPPTTNPQPANPKPNLPLPMQSNSSAPLAIFNFGSCSAASSMDTVVKTCLGQRTCTLSASNSVFGDPCPSIYKQLSVQFACGAGPATYSVAASAPETTFAQVTCPVGYHVQTIDSASFGNATASCSASSSIFIAKAECLGKSSCFLAKENFGQDPCPGIRKSLSIRATCRPNLDSHGNPVSVVIQNTIPQDGFARIQCPGVFSIANVLFASYGNPYQGDVLLTKAEFTSAVTAELQNRLSQVNGNFQVVQRQYQRYLAQRQRNSACMAKAMIDRSKGMYKSSVIAAAQDVQQCIDGSLVRQ